MGLWVYDCCRVLGREYYIWIIKSNYWVMFPIECNTVTLEYALINVWFLLKVMIISLGDQNLRWFLVNECFNFIHLDYCCPINNFTILFRRTYYFLENSIKEILFQNNSFSRRLICNRSYFCIKLSRCQYYYLPSIMFTFFPVCFWISHFIIWYSMYSM